MWASATNSCQAEKSTLKSPPPGADPCTELRPVVVSGAMTRIKRTKPYSTAERFATGIRNAEGFAIDSSGRVFVTQHGRTSCTRIARPV